MPFIEKLLANNIVLNDKKVSRWHAVIQEFEPNGV
ncbi:MAG: hypothetical protein M2R45_00540 [Verrucomicrobia subdivision 3 bacterium]|nr:hypothetical protein [Limisphaerales bacterium]MCS1413582.1 hypothetical protein [Limisphaerales bacterium]